MRKKNNWDFLNEIDPSKRLYNEISYIEDNLSEPTLDVRIKLGKTLELLGKKIFNFDDEKIVTIKEIKDRIWEEYRLNHGQKTYIPGVVHCALTMLQTTRNDNSHSDKNEVYGQREDNVTLFQRINYLQNFYQICIFIYNEMILDQFSKPKNIWDFDTSIYQPIEKTKIDLSTKASDYKDDELIEVKKVSIGNLVLDEKINFYIPSYQRGYSWTIDYCEDLITTINMNMESNESQYFGSIAITSSEEKEVKTYRLIDGQQRITTSIIIFRVIYDLLNSKLESNIPDELIEIFNKNKVDKNKIINKTGNDLEESALKELINEKSNELLNNRNFLQYKNTNVFKNYKKIYELLSSSLSLSGFNLNEDYNVQKIINFYEYYKNNYHISVIKFNKNLKQEMDIFENLNSRGMELTLMELAKNAVFLRIDSKVFEKNEDEIVKLFNNNLNIREMNIPTDLIKDKDYIQLENKFLYDYLILRTEKISHKLNDRRSMLKVFQYSLSGGDWKFEEYKKWIASLGKYFRLFIDLKTKGYKNTTSSLYPFRNYLDVFHEKGALIILMYYILDLFEEEYDHNNHKIKYKEEKIKEINDCFFEIEKWIFMVVQCKGGQSPVTAALGLINYLKKTKLKRDDTPLNLTISKWLSGVIGGEDNTPKNGLDIQTPSKEEIYISLTTKPIKSPLQSIFLRRIEEFSYNEGNYSQEIRFEEPTIEHIIPQTLTNSWKEMLITNNKTILNSSNVDEYMKSKIDYIGNLLLLPKDKNSKIQNDDFLQKIKIYKKYNIHAATKELMNNEPSLVEMDFFDIDSMEKRTNTLAKMLMDKIYKYEN